MINEDGPRGSGWHGPVKEIKSLGWRFQAGIPRTLLIDAVKFRTRWVCEELRVRHSKKIHYVVRNVLNNVVVLVTDDKREGELAAARLGGWQEAGEFPPTKREEIVIVEQAPPIQLTEREGDHAD